MKVKIGKQIDTYKPWEIKKFIETVAKFSKKFYSVETGHIDTANPILYYHAVAVSRDIIYEVWWNVYCEKLKDYKPVETHMEFSIPPYGVNPIHQDVADYLFPLLHEAYDPILRYINVFEYNQFMVVQNIDFEK